VSDQSQIFQTKVHCARLKSTVSESKQSQTHQIIGNCVRSESNLSD